MCLPCTSHYHRRPSERRHTLEFHRMCHPSKRCCYHKRLVNITRNAEGKDASPSCGITGIVIVIAKPRNVDTSNGFIARILGTQVAFIADKRDRCTSSRCCLRNTDHTQNVRIGTVNGCKDTTFFLITRIHRAQITVVAYSILPGRSCIRIATGLNCASVVVVTINRNCRTIQNADYDIATVA